MNPLRRTLLRGVSGASLIPLLGSGLLFPRTVLAADWNKAAFSARNLGDAMKAYGAAGAVSSADLLIQAPEIAENGAKVDVELTSNIPGTQSLALFADKNPMPLCAVLRFSENMLPFARLQIKLAESTRVRAVAKASDGKSYVTLREIKVTAGGCGA